jgi:two-component sensor histidine kinase
MPQHSFAPDAAVLPAPLHLLEELSHRVFNEYTEAVLTLSAAASGSASPLARETLSRVAQRLVAQAHAHRALLPPADGGLVNLADYIGELCATLCAAFLEERGIRLSLNSDEVWLDADRVWRIGLVVAELVRNAARHGLRNCGGLISIRLLEEAGQVSCLVCDDGCADTQPSPGRGQGLVMSLAAELGGGAEWWFTPAGCLARLHVPSGRPAVKCVGDT